MRQLDITALVLFLACAGAASGRADTLRLKNGKSFDGEILKQDDGAVLLRLPGGTELEFDAAQVAGVEINDKGKTVKPVIPETGTAADFLSAGEAFEQSGDFPSARACYTRGLTQHAGDAGLQARLEALPLAERIFAASHPEAMLELLRRDVTEQGAAALPIIERHLEADLAELESFQRSPRLDSLRNKLMTELGERRRRLVAFVRNKDGYFKNDHEVRGQADVDELMRAVKVLYTRAGEPEQLNLDDDFRAARQAVTVLLELHAKAGGDNAARKDWQARQRAAIEALRAPLDFAALDREKAGNAEILRYNEEFKLEDRRKKLAWYLNDYRLMAGLSPLRLHEDLNQAAQGHSDEMLKMGYYAHVSPVAAHAEPQDRMRRAGYPLSEEPGVKTSGEVLTAGPLSPDDAMTSWQESPDHHRCILERVWIDVGIGFAGDMWTVNMAVPNTHEEK